MIRKIARYTVRPGKLPEVEDAIKKFVAAVSRAEPETIYTAYRIEDGVTFIHFMAFPDAEAERNHQTAPYTKNFVEALYPNCEEEPSFMALTLVE